MDPSRGDSRYNINYSMSSIGLSLADQADLYCNPAATAAALGAGGGGGGGGGGGRPPSSGGLIQAMGAGSRTSGGGGLMSNAAQCQTLNNSSGSGQSRGIKRTSSDCYDDHHRGGGGGSSAGGMTSQALQQLESCAGGNGANAGGPPDVGGGDDSYTTLQQSKKSPPANGKKTKGRVKIKMEYIDNKLRRYTTFSKRKTGIMKKAYELSTLTGTQVMLLVASETGHVYTFATRKLQPMITSEAGKQLIQTCLNSPDPPSVGGGGDQRMSATGFEETELSYNIADEDSKDERSPMSSGNESDESSDIDSPGPPSMNTSQTMLMDSNSFKEVVTTPKSAQQKVELGSHQTQPTTSMGPSNAVYYDNTMKMAPTNAPSTSNQTNLNSMVYQSSSLTNIPQEMLLSLVQSGHLQLHTEDDGSGHQYITIPLTIPSPAAASTSTVGGRQQFSAISLSGANANSPGFRNSAKDLSAKSTSSREMTTVTQPLVFTTSAMQKQLAREAVRIKEELSD